MKENKIDLTKTHAAMRSVYRFSEFKSMDAPDILIDTERNILRRYFAELTAEEIVYMVSNFETFQKEQLIQAALETEKMSGNFDRYLAETN